MIEITGIEKKGLAALWGIQTGDQLVSINRQALNDFLDLRFYQADEELKIVIRRGQNDLTFKIKKPPDEPLGIEVASPRLKSCSNDCVFCFIKQNPKGMRKSIYFCDEDYRYSFLYGNYITLLDVDDADLKRIVAQHLSPLYISVHASDPDVRKRLFRYRGDDRLFEKIEYLTAHRIELHTQIVLVPGYNDSEILERTIQDLYRFRKYLKSIAIVPVGLTKHREHLPPLEKVSPRMAKQLVERSRYWNREYRNSDGDLFVHLSDEIYLLAGCRMPSKQHYGKFYQIENGVGIVRDTIEKFKKQQRKFPTVLTSPKKILLVTGTLAAPVLEQYIIPMMNVTEGLQVDVLPVVNHFYGETITVAGLLVGCDIIEQVGRESSYDVIWLPSRCLNQDGVLLDDISLETIGNKLNTPVCVFNDDFMEMINDVGF